ncbi:leucyl aminopeptidase [Myxococcota bacterium]|nr:leucyl aminopeptidase [Myxococcota bacterium]
MKFSLARGPVPKLTPGLLVVGVPQGNPKKSAVFQELDAAADGSAEAAVRDEKFTGKAGETLLLPGMTRVGCRQVLLVGLGERREITERSYRDLGGHAGARARKAGFQRIGFALETAVEGRGGFGPRQAQALAEGLVLGGYRFQKYLKAEDQDAFDVQDVRVLYPARKGAAEVVEAMEAGRKVADAQCLARDLVNEPANVATPPYMVEYARRLAAEKGLEVRVLERPELEARGMGALLAVSQGTQHPPFLVHLTWRPGGEVKRRVALVGKCLTFDSGGYDIKPPDGMLDMKIDMGGAAAVLGTMAGIADLKPQAEVHGIFAATENMIGPAAYRPGDVLRAANGKTIEVGNTDAEGRLTLADALCYASELEVDTIVDAATLTGACVVALGTDYAGLYTDSDRLARQLVEAGESADEKLWRMPMPKEYRELFKGEVAELKNVGPRWGGSITAAMFLKEFVSPDKRWAHLDIAGPVHADKGRPSTPKGGTGYPVRLLLRWLCR